MKLDPRDTSFGRHETFPLRFGWLTKGVQALLADSDIFEQPDAPVRLGVGKNMVSAIRYWLQATGVIHKVGSRHFELTPFGYDLFGEEGADPYLEDEATIWLLHWQLATNARLSTGMYWFFNHFHKAVFSAQEVQTTLKDYAKANLTTKPAANTLKSDAALILRMYVPTRASNRVPLEDALDSPFALLNLVRRQDAAKTYESLPITRESLPIPALAYAIAQMYEHAGTYQLSLSELMYSTAQLCAPGAVFRLSEAGLVTKLEELVRQYDGAVELSDTAGIYQLYRLQNFRSTDILRAHFADATGAQAA